MDYLGSLSSEFDSCPGTHCMYGARPGPPPVGCRGKQASADSVTWAPLSVPGAVSPLSLNQTPLSSSGLCATAGSTVPESSSAVAAHRMPCSELATLALQAQAGPARLSGPPRATAVSSHQPLPTAPRRVSGGRRVRRDDGDRTEPRRPLQVRSSVGCFPAAVCTGLVRKTRGGGKGTEATCSPLQVRGLLR